MNKTIMGILTNPIKCKMLLEIQKCGRSTAKHLAETFSDIPQATLYRYLKRMTADGVLKVVSETQVRGAVEKTYGIALNLEQEFGELVVNNSGDAYLQAFLQYMLGFAELFQEYCRRDDIDIVKDKSGFSLSPLYLTDHELDELMTGLQTQIRPYADLPPANGRKLRTLGMIVSPPKNQ